MIELIKTRARTLVYATGLPPASAAAALAGLEIVESDPELCTRPLGKARAFARTADLPEPQSPIIPVVVGAAADALRAQADLEAQGFLVVAIRPPTVPDGAARLRLTFTAGHMDADIERLAFAVRAHV